MNKIIEKYAKDNEMIYLDYYSSMVDNNFALIETYGSDGVHPNKEGYKVMSSLANRAINKILEQIMNSSYQLHLMSLILKNLKF